MTATTALGAPATTSPGGLRLQEYEVPAGSRPHDVAVADDGVVCYTAQGSGVLGRSTQPLATSGRSRWATARGPTA